MKSSILILIVLFASAFGQKVQFKYNLASVVDGILGGPVVAIDGRTANSKAVDRVSADSGRFRPNAKDTVAWRWDSAFVYSGASDTGVIFGRRTALEGKTRLVIAFSVRVKNTNDVQFLFTYGDATVNVLHNATAIVVNGGAINLSVGVGGSTHTRAVSFANISSKGLMPADSFLTIAASFQGTTGRLYINAVPDSFIGITTSSGTVSQTGGGADHRMTVGGTRHNNSFRPRAGTIIDNVHVFAPTSEITDYQMKQLSLALMQAQVFRIRGQSNMMWSNNKLRQGFQTNSMYYWNIEEISSYPSVVPNLFLMRHDTLSHLGRVNDMVKYQFERSSAPAFGDSIIKAFGGRPIITVGHSRGGHGIVDSDGLPNYQSGGGASEDFWGRAYNDPKAKLFPATVNAENRLRIPTKISWWMGENDPQEVEQSGGISYTWYLAKLDSVVQSFNGLTGTVPFEVLGASGRYTSAAALNPEIAPLVARKAHWQYVKADTSKRMIGFNFMQGRAAGQTRVWLNVEAGTGTNFDVYNFVRVGNIRGYILASNSGAVRVEYDSDDDAEIKANVSQGYAVNDSIIEFLDSSLTVRADGAARVVSLGSIVMYGDHNTTQSHRDVIARHMQLTTEHLYGLRPAFRFPELKSRSGLSTVKKVEVRTTPKQSWSVPNGNYRLLWSGKTANGLLVGPTTAVKSTGTIVDTLTLTFASPVDSLFYGMENRSGTFSRLAGLHWHGTTGRLAVDTLSRMIITDSSGLAAIAIVEMSTVSKIDSVSPAYVKRGQTFTIYSSSLSDSSAGVRARMNSLACNVSRWSNGQVWATVPGSAPSGFYRPNLLHVAGTDTTVYDSSATRIRVLVPGIIKDGSN